MTQETEREKEESKTEAKYFKETKLEKYEILKSCNVIDDLVCNQLNVGMIDIMT